MLRGPRGLIAIGGLVPTRCTCGSSEAAGTSQDLSAEGPKRQSELIDPDALFTDEALFSNYVAFERCAELRGRRWRDHPRV
eukprot:1890740-Amphidinium_carterae.2